MPYETNSAIDLVKYALIGLKKIFRVGYGYKKAGVMVHDFTAATAEQITLFDQRDMRHDKLMAALDVMNKKYGQNTVRLSIQDRRLWKMRQEKLSKHYTTDLKDIIDIRI